MTDRVTPPPAPTKGRRAHDRARSAADGALAGAVGLLYGSSVLEIAERPLSVVAGLALAVVVTFALARRRQHPLAATAVALAADVVILQLVSELVVPIAGVVALWSFTVVRPPRASLFVLGAVVAIIAMIRWTDAYGDTVAGGDLVFVAAMAVTVWALAEAARNRVDAARLAAERAAAEERATIARELHDVIAHSVSVIVVQAAAADDVFDQRPDQARAAVRSIEDTGREALRELRRVLGAVRPPGDGGPDPVPGLDRLHELAEPLTAAGLDVTIAFDGDRRPLDAGVELSAYRIVQEALTNTLRHAHATRAEVTLRYGSDAIDVEVVDDGRGPTAHRVDGRGLGLVGMRERTALHGGTIEAGPTAHGGFRVHANLPIEPGVALERR